MPDCVSKILLVEDDPNDAELICQLLNEEGRDAYLATRVGCLQEALECVEGGLFDAVLLDLCLPDGSGPDVLDQLRARAPELPVVVLSGMDEAVVGDQTIRKGAQDFLSKNRVSRDLLARTIRRAIERQRAETERLRNESCHTRELSAAVTAYVDWRHEEERTRVSRELLYDLGSRLTGVIIDLDRICKILNAVPSAQDRLVIQGRIDDARELTVTSLETVRRCSGELHPSELDDLGFAAAILDEATRFEKRSGIRVAMKNPGQRPHINPETAAGLFRVFQEALMNIACHARATAVEVGLSEIQDELVLMVKDNGTGIPTEKRCRESSFGILAIRERAASIGCQTGIHESPGEGTTLLFRLPVSKAP